MTTTLQLDASRPYQVAGDLIAFWRPRGRGRDDLAAGLVGTINVCTNRACSCTLATLQLRAIDDRARRAEGTAESMKVEWIPAPHVPPLPELAVTLEVDVMTGEVRGRGGAKLPARVAEHFDEPLPWWVLDAMWDIWIAPRPPSEIDWQAQALDAWEPGTLLPTFTVYPEGRPDRYVIGGKVYQADTMFCVEPGCDCTEARFGLLRVDAQPSGGETLVDLGSAWLSPDSMIPTEFDGRAADAGIFTSLYLAWRRRNVPAESRLAELRELTRRRGAELLRRAAARAPVGSRTFPRPATPAPKKPAPPGRNDPCTCGSGKKYKRCCGA